MRLPLDRIQELKSGGAASILRQDAGIGRRPGVRDDLQPLAGGDPAGGELFDSGVGRLAAAAGGAGVGAAGVHVASHVDRPHPAAAPADSSRAREGRLAGDRGVWRDAGGAGVRAAAIGDEPHRAGQQPDGPAGAVCLVVDAGHRDPVGNADAAGHCGLAHLWRLAGDLWALVGGRLDDVPGVPGDAAGAAGSARAECGRVSERALGAGPNPRSAGGTAGDGSGCGHQDRAGYGGWADHLRERVV